MKKLSILTAGTALLLLSACGGGTTTSTSGSASASDSASSSAAESTVVESPSAPTSSGSASDSSSAGAASYTMDEIAKHATAEDCWAAIDGNAYDLTGWIEQHPGGAEAITGLCGTDATAAFEDQHAGQEEPAAALENFLLGPVAN